MQDDEMILCGDGIRRPASQLQGTHREAYPEQYTNKAVGRLHRRPKNDKGPGEVGTVDRVVSSRWGTLAHFAGAEGYYLLHQCERVDG